MSFSKERDPRRLIPRWRRSARAVQMGEAGPIVRREFVASKSVDESMASKLSDWRETRALGVAFDIVTCAALSEALKENSDVRAAAEAVVRAGADVPEVARRLAKNILSTDESSAPDDDPKLIELDSGVELRRLRARRLNEPRNAIVLIDMAREYSSLGQDEQAAKCIRWAIAIAPEHRFILRSAARFFLHQGRADEARDILRRSQLVRHDPWVLAAEISASEVAGSTSKLVKVAHRMVEDKKFSRFDSSELTGALASLELSRGKQKDSRKLFRASLEAPTENTVAQAEWASRVISGVPFEESLARVRSAFEARAWAAWYDKRWADAVKCSQRWLGDEPFSSRPANFGAFVAGVGGLDYRMSAALARKGLRANPDDLPLLNNLIFALASDDKVDEAVAEANKLDLSRADKDLVIAVTATLGLIHFRSGDPQSGRALYQQAIDASLKGGTFHTGYALAYWAREEMRYGNTTDAAALIEKARATVQTSEQPGVEAAIEAAKRENRSLGNRLQVAAGDMVQKLADMLPRK